MNIAKGFKDYFTERRIMLSILISAFSLLSHLPSQVCRVKPGLFYKNKSHR